MSESFAGLPPAPPPSAPRDAAAVVLWRPGPRGTELFWVMRGARVGFASGFHAFPGGRLDPADAQVPVEGFTGVDAAIRACAAREVFEETGVLLVRGSAPSRDVRDEARRALLDGSLDFGAFLAAHRLAIDAARLRFTARWLTPEWLPLRFDARIFLARLPEGEEATVWPGELEHGEFIAAPDALAQWAAGVSPLHPPNLHAIRTLAAAEPDDAFALLCAPPRMDGRNVTDWIEFQQGLFSVALRTPTLPPAAHTNCWLVDVGGALAIVDPGSPWPEEQARLEELLREHAAQGRPPREVWLTHEHRDHVSGAAAVASRHGVPLRAHAECIARLPAEARALATPLADGDLLHGRWRALHTPGHARGHLAFHDERTGALLAGDLVSTLSTIVIDPPEGDMAAYLASLARVRGLAPLRTLYPAHGAPAPDAAAALDGYLAHREARAERIAAALPGTVEEVTARAYDDTPTELHGLAARSCLATLEMLEAAGRARRAAARWVAARWVAAP